MTTKGVVRIHGKQYRTVARRVADFRANYAASDGWTIASDIIELSDTHAVIKASIVNPEGRVVCSGLARDAAGDSSRHKSAFLEICQTSAIGRALALFSLETMGEELEIASANEVQPAVEAQARPPAKEQPDLEVVQLKKALREKYILFRDEFQDDLFEYVDRKLCESDNVEDLRKALKTAEYTERMTIEDKR
tara:strand:+ start:871 stop:1449 length:579 start_codon:yes stop_codon:yes gene_type:complete